MCPVYTSQSISLQLVAFLPVMRLKCQSFPHFGKYARGLKADNYFFHANPFIPLESSFTVFSVDSCIFMCCEDFSLLGSSYTFVPRQTKSKCVNFDPNNYNCHNVCYEL